MAYKRPGYGIKPEMADVVVGRKLKRDLEKDEVIEWNYI